MQRVSYIDWFRRLLAVFLHKQFYLTYHSFTFLIGRACNIPFAISNSYYSWLLQNDKSATKHFTSLFEYRPFLLCLFLLDFFFFLTNFFSLPLFLY